METKLRLAPAEELLDDEPITEAERAKAEALRRALERGSEPLARELRAAYAPKRAEVEALDALLEQALGLDAEATLAEQQAAEALRAELAGERPVEQAAVLLALRLAAAPPALAPERNEALISRALFRARSRLTPRLMAAVATVAAVAAAAVLYLGPRERAAAPVAMQGEPAALIPARSSQGLFDSSTPFPRSGQESARIDRIAASRKADLRANRFTAWGVR